MTQKPQPCDVNSKDVAFKPIDTFRFTTLKRLPKLKSFSDVWPYMRLEVENFLGPNPTGQNVFDLGSHLSEIFRSVPSKETRAELSAVEENLANAIRSALENDVWKRDQGDVSASGTVWECLVTWYQNLICFNTELLCAKHLKISVPEVVRKGMAVTIRNSTTNSESDVVTYSVPGGLEIQEELTIEQINGLIAANPKHSYVSVTQCKTNWNDNAQIPMLWDMVYRDVRSAGGAVSVGIGGYSPDSFARFSYAFMTVPTNNKSEFTSTSTSVVRVSNLSGGNYWGRPSKQGVARSYSEFLPTNFGHFFTEGGIQNHIDRNLREYPTFLSRFLDLAF